MILAWASPFKSGLGFWSGVLWSDNLWAQKHNPLINSDIRQIMIVCQVCVSTTVILSLSRWTSGGGGASGTPGFSKLAFIITSLLSFFHRILFFFQVKLEIALAIPASLDRKMLHSSNAVQSQNTVSAYFPSKQIVHFGFAEQSG